MITGLYSGAGGMVGQDDIQAVIARNLANINTVGYKKNIASFQSIMAGKQQSGASKDASHGPVKITTDFEQGLLEYTGNNLDVALNGEGFFAVKMDDGSVCYTRRGQFTLSRDLKVVTPEGWPLLTNGGELVVPPNAKDITIQANGTVIADGKELGKIKVVKVANMKTLVPIGGCAYKLSDKTTQEEATNVEIAQGYVEKSNVNAIDEMVNMIANMRAYQSGGKVNDSIDESIKKLIKLAS